MATSNYTPNLHLSAWEATDRPKRADFVSDNTIIDTQLGGHIANGNIHLNADEKARLNYGADYTDDGVLCAWIGVPDGTLLVEVGEGALRLTLE